jgi:hypothetical protein
VDGHASDVIATNLDLAGMQPSSYLHTERPDGISDGAGAVNGSAGAVEGRYKAIPDGIDFPAPEPLDLASHHLVVAVEQTPPRLVTKDGGLLGRANDVRE